MAFLAETIKVDLSVPRFHMFASERLFPDNCNSLLPHSFLRAIVKCAAHLGRFRSLSPGRGRIQSCQEALNCAKRADRQRSAFFVWLVTPHVRALAFTAHGSCAMVMANLPDALPVQ